MRTKVIRGLAPIALVAALGLGAAACGSSGATPRTQNAPTQGTSSGSGSGSGSVTPTTQAPSSGGAGF